MNKYDTPDALRHDVGVIIDDARNLLAATANATDRAVTEARQRLATTLDRLRYAASHYEDIAAYGARQTDACIRRHPYSALGIAFVIGAILAGLFLARR
jgi:ElaB/YqjD/DUF883 family membrane-anchored ribosome-binding protein